MKMGKLAMGTFCYTFGWNAATICLWNMEWSEWDRPKVFK